MPTYAEHTRFCRIDGWREVKSARGKTPDHLRFVKRLRSGEVLRTKVSHGDGEYGPGLWNDICKRQLALASEHEFWEALRTGEPVARQGDGEPEAAQPTALPRDLFWQLVNSLGMDEHEAAQLSVEQAVRRMTEHWIKRPPSA